MYRSLSMAKTNQLTEEQKVLKLQLRRQQAKRGQQKAINNHKFYREVEEERFNINQYGPIYFYFPDKKDPY